MTLANDFISDISSVDFTSDVRSAAEFVGRVVQLVIGVGLTFVAALMWIAPGAIWDADVILMKAVLSITAFIAGVIVVSIGRTQDSTEIEVDAAKGTLRAVQVSAAGQRSVKATMRFEDLHKVESDGPVLRFWQDEHTVLAEVGNIHTTAIANLSYALRRAGKLA